MPTLIDLVRAAKKRRDETQTALTRTGNELTVLRDGADNVTMDEARAAIARHDSAKADHALAEAELAELLREQEAADRDDALQRQTTGNPSTAGHRAGNDDDGPRWVRATDGRPAAISRSGRFADHAVVAEHAARASQREQAIVGQHGGVGQLVRALTTTSGSALVPTVWAGQIIDRARNISRVLQAGAEIVPMDAKVVQIGRLTADPTAAFRTEGSTVTASDPTFDNVTLTATTMSALVVGSMEWFQDAADADTLVAEAIAKAIALQLDLAALYGGVTTGAGSINLPTPPNPRGVLATLLAVASSSVLGSAANGTTQTAATYFAELLDAIYTPRYNNEEPNALIANAKLFRQYAGAADTTNQPLAMPSDVADMQRLTSNQVPSYTQGTMTGRATDVFVGDWRQLLIGQRLDLSVQVLTERYAENGQVGIIAHWRGDVGLARPRAFSVFRALQGAV